MPLTVAQLRAACLCELAQVSDSVLPELLRQVRVIRGRVPKPRTGPLTLPKTGPMAATET
jgi:hypothetical protein